MGLIVFITYFHTFNKSVCTVTKTYVHFLHAPLSTMS